MSFFDRTKQKIREMLKGRYGTDEFSLAILIAAIFCLLLSYISIIACYLSIALYSYCIFRMLSRNFEKRSKENMRYLSIRNSIRTGISQGFTRLKNGKKYKYVRCPECKTLIRLPRKVGHVNVTCPKCNKDFNAKA